MHCRCLLPQAFHLISSAGGKIFCRCISLFFGRDDFGADIWNVNRNTAPLISALLTGTPVRLPFMIIELADTALQAGRYTKRLVLQRKYGTGMSLVIAMLFGRILYALTLLSHRHIDITALGAFEAVKATIAGVYGIILHF